MILDGIDTSSEASTAAAVTRATWWWCLGHNLAVIGFGFAAFRAGDNFGFHMGEDHGQCACQWTPSRGVPYVGARPCEFETDDQDDLDDGRDTSSEEDYSCIADDSTECDCPSCVAAEDSFWADQGEGGAR